MPASNSTEHTPTASLFVAQLMTMEFYMFLSCDENKILGIIIKAILIQMMNKLMRFQQTTIRLFPNEAMFKNITSSFARFMCMRMVRHVNHSVTIEDNKALKIRRIFSSLWFKVTMDITYWLSFMPATFAVTKWSQFRWLPTTAFAQAIHQREYST